MDLAGIRRLHAYNRWANARFFDAAASLTPEQYGAEVASSFPSIRDTLAHLVATEWIWLQRWQGTSPTAAPPRVLRPGLAALRARLEEVEAATEALVATLAPESLARTVEYRRLGGEARANALGDLLVHVVNHATYHRGQLTTLLRQVGGTPPSTDFVVFAAGVG